MQLIRTFTIVALWSGSLFNQVGCQTKQVTESITNNGNTQSVEANVSDEEIKQLFIDSGLGDGDGNLIKLMALPKERVISVVRNLKKNGLVKGNKGYQTEEGYQLLKIKSAYFLWTLGVDSAANEKYVVDAAKNKDLSSRFNAFTYLENIIADGRKQYLPMIFQSAPEVDNAFAMEMLGCFVIELENSPRTFLIYLSKEHIKIRKSVYDLVSYTENMYGREMFEKINANVKELTKDKETEKIAQEFLRKVNTKQ